MLAALILGLCLASPQEAAISVDQNPMALNAEMRDFLDAKIDRGLPPLRRLESLVASVFQDPALSFTYSEETRSAIETFTQRSGNCLSFTLLFISMARYVNLDARFREVEIAPVWTKSGSFVNLSEHINAAVHIGGQAYAIDVFPAVNRIEIGGQEVSDERGMAHFFNNKAVDELGSGDFDAADAFLKKALELDPETVPVWINLGAASAQRGNLIEAERYYRKALDIDHKSLAAMSNLANVCEVTGRVKEAIRLQEKVREFREKNPYHHYNLGEQAFEDGLYEEAVEHYKRAIKLKATDDHFYFALARTYARLNRTDDVVNSLKLAEKYASDPANKLRYSQKLELLLGRTNLVSSR